MKKGISALFAVILMITLAQCKGDVSGKIYKRYQDMQSYTAKMTVTVNGNKSPMVYRLSQSYRAPGDYRTEVLEPERMSGTVSVICGQEIWLRSAQTPAIQLEQGGISEEMHCMFLGDFLRRYFSQENLPALQENAEGLVLLTASDEKQTRYRFGQNLWIDAKSNLPRSLVTYDQDGNEVVRVDFEDFVPDAPITDSVFLP